MENKRYLTKIGFARPEDIHVDNITHTPAGRIDTKHRYHLKQHSTTINNLNHKDSIKPGLAAHGFTVLNLSTNTKLQQIFANIRTTGLFTTLSKQNVLQEMLLSSFQSSDNKHTIRIINPVSEGLFLRQTGPNGIPITDVNGETSMGSAKNAHVDNNVDGTPLKQYIRGFAPWIFHHISPGKTNLWSPLYIMRIWIPLYQPVRPLVIMDQNTFNRSTEQIAFHLPTGDFMKTTKQGLSKILSTGEDLSLVDVWHIIHGKQQEWYFYSDMNHTQGYAFSTLDGAHTSCSLPGEEIASLLFEHINSIVDAIEHKSEDIHLSKLYLKTSSIINDANDAKKKVLKRSQITIGLSTGIEEMIRCLHMFQKEMNGSSQKNRNLIQLIPVLRLSQSLVIRQSVEITSLAIVTRNDWNYYDCLIGLVVVVMCVKWLLSRLSKRSKVFSENKKTRKKKE